MNNWLITKSAGDETSFTVVPIPAMLGIGLSYESATRYALQLSDQAQTIVVQADEIERLMEVERENALKLKQILDLEETLYATRIINMNDGSPCWCVFPSFESGPHSDYCAKAREATETMWKREALKPQEPK